MHSAFFAQCRSLDALKQEYRRLAKIHHPDVGGDLETMKRINSEYDSMVKWIASHPEHHDQKAAASENTSEFMRVVAALLHIPGILVELCGTWIWVTGNTYPVKDALKTAGFAWSKTKTAWYWHNPDDGMNSPFRHKGMDMGYIRAKYGSERLNGKEENNQKLGYAM